MTEIEESTRCISEAVRGLDQDRSVPSPTEFESRAQAWEALARAQAEYDPAVLRAAEARVIAAYRELALLLVRQHERGGVPTDVTVLAALLGLARAVQQWSDLGNPSDFEEFARGRIDAEIRAAHDLFDGGGNDSAPDSHPLIPATATPIGWPLGRPDRYGHHHGTPPPALFTVDASGDTCEIHISGPLDVSGAESLTAILKDVTTPHRRVRLNLSGITFFAAAGLRALVDGDRALAAVQGGLVITGVNARTRRLMQITGHDRTLRLEPTDTPPDVPRIGATQRVRIPRAPRAAATAKEIA